MVGMDKDSSSEKLMGPFLCKRTTPIPTMEMSHITSKGSHKLGKANTGV